jgi:NAD-dependent oxidoreductase involved in siderophore biosynthesis
MTTKTIKEYPKTNLTNEQIIALRRQAEKNGAERASNIFYPEVLARYQNHLEQKKEQTEPVPS